jgi:membrane fusion protein, multidrug efflux system
MKEDSPGPPPQDDPSPSNPARAQDSVPERVVRRRPPRSKLSRILLPVGVLILLVGGFFLWRHLESYESTDDAQVDVHLYPVSARISGHVIQVTVDDNQYVPQGTQLVEIDPTDYQVAVDKARADLASAEATAQSLNITVPVTSVNTSSQLSFSASDVENANAGIIAAEKQLAAAHAQSFPSAAPAQRTLGQSPEATARFVSRTQVRPRHQLGCGTH